MRRLAWAALALAAAIDCRAADPWEFALTAYPTQVRGGTNSTSAIATADHGALHLEGRYGYEAIDARSAFVGWTFANDEKEAFTWELTPLVGTAWGSVHAFVPGLEVSAAWKRLDFYTEVEFVRDHHDSSSSYNYAWSELGFKAMEWLRIGAAGQHTRLYGGDREYQRGPFAQVSYKFLTIGGYWFNPGAKDQVFVGMIGVAF